MTWSESPMLSIFSFYIRGLFNLWTFWPDIENCIKVHVYCKVLRSFNILVDSLHEYVKMDYHSCAQLITWAVKGLSLKFKFTIQFKALWICESAVMVYSKYAFCLRTSLCSDEIIVYLFRLSNNVPAPTKMCHCMRNARLFYTTTTPNKSGHMNHVALTTMREKIISNHSWMQTTKLPPLSVLTTLLMQAKQIWKPSCKKKFNYDYGIKITHIRNYYCNMSCMRAIKFKINCS